MSITRRKKYIGDKDRGVALTVLTDKKLKTNSFIIHFINPLERETAAASAAVAFMLEDTCREYPDITSFSRRLAELYGANIRGGISRFSDSQVITFSGSCISDKYALEGEKVSAELLELLCGCIFDPVTENDSFSEKLFRLKKQELIDDIDADINDKRIYALKKAGEMIFAGEPAGIAVRGERADAEALTCDMVFKAYKKLLSSAKIEIIFVGCELPEECEKMLDEKFSALDRSEVYLPEIKRSPAKSEVINETERLDVTQSKMVMAFKFTERNLPVEKIFTAVYGGTPFSLLFKNVREKLSLCYYCSASLKSKKGVIMVDSGVENANISAAREEILRQLEAVRNGDFSNELLEDSKRYMVSALKSVNDTPRAVADWYYSYCLDSEEETCSPEQFIEKIEAVTKDDVTAFARSVTLDTVYVLTSKED